MGLIAKGDLLGPRHLDDLVLTFRAGAAPVPPATKGHQDLGSRAGVKKPHAMGRRGSFIKAEDQAGLAPAKARGLLGLKH
jgi:hypothetical protein